MGIYFIPEVSFTAMGIFGQKKCPARGYYNLEPKAKKLT
jgi:hypothetical protein